MKKRGIKKRAFKKRLKSANRFNYELALFWDHINDLILMGCWQKWPEPVIDCLLDLASFLHPAYKQRQRLYKRYGVKEK